ncbi:MAG TPA: DUF4229 domain-containing protein [Streptosporangiaceae bacterium]|nr:DUF4229 domain-containing protein [Streptosporangiaceae bacterium]
MRSVLAYTTARLLLFVAATGLLYLAGARGLLLLGLALLASGIASYVLLSRQRDRMSGALSARLAGARGKAGRFRSRLDAGTRAEDGDDQPAAGPPGVPSQADGTG